MSFVCFFFFKQKTAYEMRISDWSSDVCSSDLLNDSVEVDVVTNTLPAPAFPVVPPLPMTRLPSLITVFPVNVLLPVRTQLPLSFLASVVTPVQASPIVPASGLLPVLVPPSPMVRAWLLLASVTVPVSVMTVAPANGRTSGWEKGGKY